MWPERPFCKELPYSSKDKQGFIKSKGQYRVRKRGTLREDSSLGLKGINILYINLSRLVGEKSCTIPCTLFRNRYQVLTFALANLRANAFALIDTKYVTKLADFLNAPLEKLPKLILICGYNRQIGQPITSILRIHLR